MDWGQFAASKRSPGTAHLSISFETMIEHLASRSRIACERSVVSGLKVIDGLPIRTVPLSEHERQARFSRQRRIVFSYQEKSDHIPGLLSTTARSLRCSLKS